MIRKSKDKTMTVKKYDKEMRRILICVKEQRDSDILNDPLTTQCIFQCITDGYIRDLSGILGPNKENPLLGNIVITKAGLEFIENKNFKLRINFAIIFSIIAFFISILSSLQEIIEGVELLGRWLGLI
jgi:hypothetical protein